MLKKRLIPVILFHDWKMVKTINFSSMRNYGSPVVAAKVYNAQKVDELIFLDIRASIEKREPNYEAVNDIISQCFMPITVGGGVSSAEHVRRLLSLGADKVAINTALLQNPTLAREIAESFGSSCIVGVVDVKRGSIVSHSGTRKWPGKPSTWARRLENLGVGEILVNSVDRDGTMQGYDLGIISDIAQTLRIPVIAAGGAGQPQHFVSAIVAGADAVAAGSIFLYTEYSPISVRKYMREKGVEVRPY